MTDLLGHRRELEAIIAAVEAAPALSERGLQRILKRHPRDGRGLFAKADLIAAWRQLVAGDAAAERAFLAKVRLKPVRTASGVTPVTVLTRPFPCPGRCVFCPSDVRMPKSYLSDEPGAQRAAANRFDPYRQAYNRLLAFARGGHSTDKVELLVLGGTWSSYPEGYQRWFVTRLFDALNDFGARDRRGQAARGAFDPGRVAATVDGRSVVAGGYNDAVAEELRRQHDGALVPAAESATWAELERAQRRNETASSRSVGLVLETRPDQVDAVEVVRLRRLGATKLQLGLQSLDDRILGLNRRGHTTADSRRAVRLLRRAGFKLNAHWMANLRGATAASDRADFARLFDDPGYRPDELKVYPTSLIESAELMRYYACGSWRPYGHDELVALLADCLRTVPPWCRVTRVIRDIPATDIVAGNRRANLREVAEAELRRRGRRPRDIRAREIRNRRFEATELELVEHRYQTSSGDERFLELVTPGAERLVAFLRLHLPAGAGDIDEVGASALIRELHVYGTALEVGVRAEGRAQHLGFGRRLLARAAAIAAAAGYADVAVISAIGTRGYYRKLGFTDGELYQHLMPAGAE